MDRKQATSGTAKGLEKIDKEYWSKATVEEKLKTITYLRECFYGPENYREGSKILYCF